MSAATDFVDLIGFFSLTFSALALASQAAKYGPKMFGTPLAKQAAEAAKKVAGK